MAIPTFLESFGATDYLNSRTKYDYFATEGNFQSDARARGGRGFVTNDAATYLGRNVGTSGEVSIIIGARFFNINNEQRGLLSVRNVANAVNHLTLGFSSSGFLQLWRGPVSSGTLLATSSSSYPINVLLSIGMKATINSSTGSYTVYVGGAALPEMTATNVNTQSGASADITAYFLGSIVGPSATRLVMNDWFVMDGSNDFPGDVYVDYLVVNAAGNYQQFTPSTGTDHSALLDEVPPNTTDFVSSATTGHKETNGTVSLSGTSLTIITVQALNFAFKSDAGAALARNLIRSSTTDANGATYSLSETGLYFFTPFPIDPATGVAWTASGVDAMEVGIENVT